jgi:hypothetical protein
MRAAVTASSRSRDPRLPRPWRGSRPWYLDIKLFLAMIYLDVKLSPADLAFAGPAAGYSQGRWGILTPGED